LVSPSLTQGKTTAIDPVRNKPTTPAMFLTLIVLRVGANQALASKKAILGVARKSRPVAILGDEHMWRSPTFKDGSPKDPIAERIAAGYCYIVICRSIAEEELGNKS
jgi:hypothetical protein